MTLRLHNTLTATVEEFQPLHPPRVGLYVCGLTVYSRGHIGNFRTFLAMDVLRRTLEYLGHDVHHVMNVTDVDDRIIQLATAAGQDIPAFTAEHVRAFHEDMATLRLLTPHVVPHATAHVPEMVELISALISRGHTYTAEGSVYFRIDSFPEYGRLARLDRQGMKAGARVDTDKYDKENPQDFALWKLKSDEPAWAQWDAPFGRGRPGWHIECSAMSMKYLGRAFDLHGGGIDLVFPHHENEIAQAVCGTGEAFARHWFHSSHLLVEGETMSKSKGNVFNIPDILARGHRPEALRYLLSSAHYRTQLNFTWEGLGQAAAALARIRGLVGRLREVEGAGPAGPAAEMGERAEAAFRAALEDDLNTSEALAAVHGLVNEANALLAGGGLRAAGAEALLAHLVSMDRVFGVFLPWDEDHLSTEEQALFDARQAARRQRDFARADVVRKQLEERGVLLEDSPKGTRWRRRS